MTNQTPTPFPVFTNDDTTGSTYFRIPFLLRTSKDTLIAGTDANFGSAGDSAENIDAALRLKPNASQHTTEEGWQDAFIPHALHFKDYTDELGYRQQSASLIDGCIVEDTAHSGRIRLIIDLWAWNGGLFSYLHIAEDADMPGGYMRRVAGDDGFCELDGRRFLLLSTKNIMGSDGRAPNNINRNTDRTQFDLAADIQGEPDDNGRFKIYRLSGRPAETSGADSGLSLDGATDYTLTRDFELYHGDTPLTVRQRSDDETYTNTRVPMKIFYKDSIFQVYNTSYLLQVSSGDDGQTWQTDGIITAGLKKPEHSFFLLGPGRGLQLTSRENHGRTLIPIYYQDRSTDTPDKFLTAVLLSDDGGQTWSLGGTVPSEHSLSESIPVEGRDGEILLFIRNTATEGGAIALSRSQDGGETWTPAVSALGDSKEGVNCQVSALRLSKPAAHPDDPTGPKYPVICLLSASTRARKHGVIHVGLLKDEIEWVGEVPVTEQKILFGYSSMTELADGRVAVLYEMSPDSKWSTGLQHMFYKEVDVLEVLS